MSESQIESLITFQSKEVDARSNSAEENQDGAPKSKIISISSTTRKHYFRIAANIFFLFQMEVMNLNRKINQHINYQST